MHNHHSPLFMFICVTSSTLQNVGGVYTPDSVEDVFALLTSKHPNKHLSQSLLLLWLLKTLSEHLLMAPKMSTCKTYMKSANQIRTYVI